jgi:hypothetical protein
LSKTLKAPERSNNNSNKKPVASASTEPKHVKPKSHCMSLFIENICRQISLDTDLRNLKKWFTHKAHQYKWAELTSELWKRGIGTTDQENKELFVLSEGENDTLLSIREKEGTCSRLVESYVRAEKFWSENLQHKCSKSEVENCLSTIDAGKKGRIEIGDLLKFTNSESEQCYRSSEIYLILRRVGGKKGEVTAESICK